MGIDGSAFFTHLGPGPLSRIQQGWSTTGRSFSVWYPHGKYKTIETCCLSYPCNEGEGILDSPCLSDCPWSLMFALSLPQLWINSFYICWYKWSLVWQGVSRTVTLLNSNLYKVYCHIWNTSKWKMTYTSDVTMGDTEAVAYLAFCLDIDFSSISMTI